MIRQLVAYLTLIVVIGFVFNYLHMQSDNELAHLYHSRYHGHEPPECTPYEELGVLEKLTASPQRDDICKEWFIEQHRPWYINKFSNPLISLFDLAGQCMYALGAPLTRLVHYAMSYYRQHQSWLEVLISPITTILTLILLYYLILWALVPLIRTMLLYRRDKCIVESERTKEQECIPYRLQMYTTNKQL